LAEVVVEVDRLVGLVRGEEVADGEPECHAVCLPARIMSVTSSTTAA
jgi:hypothetical protein